MKTIGFPKMLVESGEKRDFTPDFFNKISGFGLKILLEEGYGDRLGFTQSDYLKQNTKISFVSRVESFSCDIVVIIRTPSNVELSNIKKGTTLFSMIHFSTHKIRCEFLREKGVNMIAMDSVVDDFNKRMIEYIDGTARNGVRVAVDEFLKLTPRANGINFLIIGSGLVGKTAVDAAVHSTKLPTTITTIGRSVTSNLDLFSELVSKTDILVDATFRKDTTKIIVPNRLIGHLNQNAIILDLTADDYDINTAPIQVKAIEGIPTGNLEKFVFNPDDIEFRKIPKEINSDERRTTVSCYSWPGVNALECLKVYQKQLVPFIKVLSESNIDNITPNSSDFYTRALGKGRFEYY